MVRGKLPSEFILHGKSLCQSSIFSIINIAFPRLGINQFSIFINQVIWDKHASANGLAALLVCLLAGTFYKQAPRRGERAGGK